MIAPKVGVCYITLPCQQAPPGQAETCRDVWISGNPANRRYFAGDFFYSQNDVAPVRPAGGKIHPAPVAGVTRGQTASGAGRLFALGVGNVGLF